MQKRERERERERVGNQNGGADIVAKVERRSQDVLEFQKSKLEKKEMLRCSNKKGRRRKFILSIILQSQ